MTEIARSSKLRILARTLTRSLEFSRQYSLTELVKTLGLGKKDSLYVLGVACADGLLPINDEITLFERRW